MVAPFPSLFKIRRGLKRFTALTTIGCALSACATVDEFSSRAVNYNIQAEEIKNQGILLNIVRAAFRRPRQFTDLSTVAGQASGSIGAELSLPFAAIPGGTERTFSISPTALFSGGPNFNVSILNTQEFYKGILTPVPLSLVTLYVREGIPRETLFTLLFSDIAYGRPTAMTHRYNNIGNDRHFQNFQTLLRTLIRHGLDVESIEEVSPIGAPLDEKEVRSVQSLSKIPEGVRLGKYAVADADPNLPEAEKNVMRQKGTTHYYRMERRTVSHRFCFDENYTKAGTLIGDTGLRITPELLCGAAAQKKNTDKENLPRGGGAPGQVQTLVFSASQGEPATELSITTRSVEQIIYYLGEIARRQLELGDGAPLYPSVYPRRFREDPSLYPQRFREDPSLLFYLRRGRPNERSIAVFYRGSYYWIDVDPKGDDLSSQVLEIVAQLLALSTSAKDLPTPNIIPVITR
jgi:hypothetical protein